MHNSSCGRHQACQYPEQAHLTASAWSNNGQNFALSHLVQLLRYSPRGSRFRRLLRRELKKQGHWKDRPRGKPMTGGKTVCRPHEDPNPMDGSLAQD
jgi:hypothetical protein